jgi:DNA-binding transcriptional LysR family regulator
VQRGAVSDGWRETALPRRIRYWTDDLQLLLGFVRAGQALAYLPDFAQEAEKLVRIEVSDQVLACSEQVYLVWNRATAGRWLAALAAHLAQREL